MDDFDDRLTKIIARIAASSVSEEEKADAYASVRAGLARLVWPMITSRIPETELKNAVEHPETLTVERYGELIRMAFDDPSAVPEIHAQVMAALAELDGVLSKALTPNTFQ